MTDAGRVRFPPPLPFPTKELHSWVFMGMNPETYVENAIVTESRDFDAIRERLTDRNLRLLHAAMGVATEAGELLDAIKKALFYGRELDTVNFKEEIGDACWYFAIAIHELDTNFEAVMDTNIAKLKARYGEKFSAARALKRDLTIERRILEGDAPSPIEVDETPTPHHGCLGSEAPWIGRYPFDATPIETLRWLPRCQHCGNHPKTRGDLCERCVEQVKPMQVKPIKHPQRIGE